MELEKVNVLKLHITKDLPISKFMVFFKAEKKLKGSLDSIPSPSPSVKIQIMDGKVGLRCKGKILLSVVNKLFCTKSLLTTPSHVWPKK